MSVNIHRAHDFAMQNLLPLCAEVLQYQSEHKLPPHSLLRELADILQTSSLDFAVAENLVSILAVRHLAKQHQSSF